MFRCIHCGFSTKELTCEGSASLDTIELKLCDYCHETADIYLEYDIVVILLDIVLMKKTAYHHVLFNTKFERHWKMAILIMLVQGFFDWSTKCYNPEAYRSDITIFNEKMYANFLKQMSFFFSLSLFEFGFFVCYITALLHIYWFLWPPKRPPGFSHLILWKAMVLASFQQFFLIAPIIWQMLNSELHVLAVQVFWFLSTSLAFSVVCYTSWGTSAAFLGCGAICKFILRHLVIQYAVSEDTPQADLCSKFTL